MCLGYNNTMKKKYTSTLWQLFLGTFLASALPVKLMAQNVASPYSILGIGDIDSKDFGRYFASGNASIARRDFYAYNFANPASLTALPFKTMHFDIAFRGRSASYSYPTADTSLGIPSNDFVIKRISMAFRLNEKTGIAFGLKPYSSVNYLYLQNNAILDGNTSYFKLVEGDGGINQFYFSIAKITGKRMSAGITASWLFGSLLRTTQYISPSIALNIKKKETDFYTGAIFQGGIQYYSLPGKKWRHQVGLTSSVTTGLHGELTTAYTENIDTVKSDIETGRNFKLPVSLGIGYSAVKNDRLSLSIDANYYHWPYQKVNYAGSYTYPSVRVSGGFEYSFIKKMRGGVAERGHIGAGFSGENNYMRIKNNNMWDFSFSAGGGKNISRHLSLYTGVEIGKRGDKKLGQIQEKYTQFIIGLTLKEIWIGPKYSSRYD
jgi:hypothetical protein